MDSAFLAAGLAVGLSSLLVAWRRLSVGEMVRARLAEPAPVGGQKPAEPIRVRPFVQAHPRVPWVGGLLLAVGLFLASVPMLFAATVGLIAGLLGSQLETFRLGRATLRFEEQLADAIDLVVASLQAGGGTLNALQRAAQESRQPLRPMLRELAGRIRLGDNPQVALRTFEARAPLETVRLLVSALSVHWEAGGSLAPTLATVGRVIRDRLEVARRVRTLTTQARVSTVAILLLTYFIALVSWRNDPERMQQFLAAPLGQVLVACATLLQAVGIAWASTLSRVKC